MKWITHAEHVKKFEIKMTFNDGKKAVVDFEPLLIGEIFKPLTELEYFKKFFVHSELDVITWPNGADFSPDYLYEYARTNSALTA